MQIQMRSSDLTIVDGPACHDTVEVLSERFGRKLTLAYPKLKPRLDYVRAANGFRPAVRTAIPLACAPASEGQERLSKMLMHAGFEPEPIHYRDAYLSLPPGRNPAEGTGTGKSRISFAARIAYIVGLQERFDEPQLLVMTHTFELFYPLMNLAHRVTRRGGRVGLTFFASLLDPRWRTVGLLEKTLELQFLDLDDYSEELLGVDLSGKSVRAIPGSADPLDSY